MILEEELDFQGIEEEEEEESYADAERSYNGGGDKDTGEKSLASYLPVTEVGFSYVFCGCFADHVS